MNQKDHYIKENKKSNWTNEKDQLGKKITTQFATLRSKTCSYLADDNDENKKGKGTKSVS